jgi:UDP:flavonoid glycosyltransferase YjiC (YdhE family)
VSQSQSPGFLDAVTTAFLRRRLQSRRLRVAALRGLKTVSNGAGDGLQMDFDHAASCFAHATPWMAARTEELATAPAPPAELPRVPPLSIVIMVIGSRGDIQPFIPIGRRLAERHRVRIATHREFRPMVERDGLEFYPLGGDPHEMMEYIVKTKGSIVPTRLDQLWEDVPKKRAMIAEILESTWRACTEPDPERPEAQPFRADLIVANPPSYGHIHCAEALHVPLHMIFTMPWTATTAFPHPFARIDPGAYRPIENFFSYGIVDLLVWAGIGDLVDDFRTKTLNLSPITLVDGASLLDDHEVPFTYLWPASLVPKPKEWGPHIDLANFIEYEQAHTYQPPQSLLDFLAAGEAPIYVGFGSVVAEDPAALTRTIFTALDKANARGIVSRGWAHLGNAARSPNVYVIDDVPHDWLFARCRAVCHHGGAGTTSAGLRAGLPTVVVPFFGDQFFWGGWSRMPARAPSRFRSAGSPPRRSPRPSTPVGSSRCANGRASSGPDCERPMESSSPCSRSSAIFQRPPCTAPRTRTTWRSSSAIGAASVSAGSVVAWHMGGTWYTPTAMSTGVAVRRTDSWAS